jgi:MoaA/NifB/PqqE/SkfB family radical SAM enzyme
MTPLELLPAVKPASEFDTETSLCLFRIPKHGARVIWEVTNTCNYGCRYCIFSSTPRQQRDELDTAKIFETVSALKENGFTHVKITGGEPFTRPDIMDILRECRAAGLKTDISTNASMITQDIAAELADLSLEMVHVSIDGSTREMHEAVRGKRTWEPTLDGLRHLAAAEIQLRAGCVIYKGNEDELAAIAAFCADEGCDEVIFSRMEPVGRMRGKQEFVSTLSNAELQTRVAAAALAVEGRIKVSGSFAEPAVAEKCGACPGGERFLFIDHKGRVSPCTWVAERKSEYRAGKTLHDHSLEEILKGPENMAFRSIVTNLRASGLKRCPMQAVPDVAEAERTKKVFSGDMAANLAAGGRFSILSPVYPFATENIGGYLDAIDFGGKSVLTVASSGDHAINVFAAGAAEVTCFDLNHLSRHILELKLALLQELPHQGYLRFFLEGSLAFDVKTYRAARERLPLATRFFWDKAYSRFDENGAALRASTLFKDTHDTRPTADKSANAIKNNPWLASDGAFDAAKRACVGKRPRFFQSDVMTLAAKLEASYDIILLSNLSDYAHKMFERDCLAAYGDQVVTPLAGKLSANGVIAFGYVYDGRDLHGSKARSPINDPVARRAAFGQEYDEVNIPSTIDDGNHDTVLLLRRA